MDRKRPKSGPGTGGESRAVRLKAALKANLGRRKAQAKARDAGGDQAAKCQGAGQGAAGRDRES